MRPSGVPLRELSSRSDVLGLTVTPPTTGKESCPRRAERGPQAWLRHRWDSFLVGGTVTVKRPTGRPQAPL